MTFKLPALRILEIVFFLGISFLQISESAEAQPVISPEGVDITWNMNIPSSQMGSLASYILIKHDDQTQRGWQEVVFLMKDGPRLKDVYQDRLSVSVIGTNVSVTLKDVTVADAGSYVCFLGGSTTVIPGCGQSVVVVRKPNPPTVKVLASTSALIGSDLHLVCETNSSSRPAGHPLTTEIFWYDHNGKWIDPTLSHGRISVDTDNHLIVRGLLLADSNIRVYCTSSERLANVGRRWTSDPSHVFSVVPEYKPSQAHMDVTPNFEPDQLIRKAIGQQIHFHCRAKCVPGCTTSWIFRPYAGQAGFGAVVNFVNPEVLELDVTQLNEGSYRCVAQNRHGSVFKGFQLEALYINNPTVYADGQVRSSVRVLENASVNLSCLLDSNPAPDILWRTPSKASIVSENTQGPMEKVASSGIFQRLYTSAITLTGLTCPDSGLYACSGRNQVSSGETQVDLVVMCPPTIFQLAGLELQPEYVWDIPQALAINFVIQAVPEPSITRIMSSAVGKSRREEMPKDFTVSKSKNYNGQSYLTRFTLTSRRTLDQHDAGRLFLVTFESSEFTRDFQFVIRPRGPPHKVANLTVKDITSDSVSLSWLPGFAGGERQMFSVQLQVVREEPGAKDVVEEVWTIMEPNIPEPARGEAVNIVVPSLRSGTSYLLRVTAINKLGQAATELEFRTADAPDSSLSSGALAAIVVVVVLALLAILAVVVYVLVFKKMSGADSQGDYPQQDTSGQSRPLLAERLSRFFQLRSVSREKKTAKIEGVAKEGDEDEQVTTPIFRPGLGQNEKLVNFFEETGQV